MKSDQLGRVLSDDGELKKMRRCTDGRSGTEGGTGTKARVAGDYGLMRVARPIH